MSEDSNEEDFISVTDNLIRERIIHVLTIYTGISNSMLQVGIGPAISPKMWHPIMHKLKEEGRIRETEVVAKGPTGRDQTYKQLWLIPIDQMVPVVHRDILRV